MVQCYKKGDRTSCKYISKHWPRTNVQSNQKYIFKLKINNKYFKRRKLFGQLKTHTMQSAIDLRVLNVPHNHSKYDFWRLSFPHEAPRHRARKTPFNYPAVKKLSQSLEFDVYTSLFLKDIFFRSIPMLIWCHFCTQMIWKKMSSNQGKKFTNLNAILFLFW